MPTNSVSSGSTIFGGEILAADGRVIGAIADHEGGQEPLPPAGASVVEGSAQPESPFRSRLDPSFNFNRYSSRAARRPSGRRRLWAALAALGLIGSALIAVRPETRYTAVSEAMLPYAATLPPIAVPGVSVAREPGAGGASAPLYSFQATSPDSNTAIAQADAASRQSAASDANAWARAIKSGGGAAFSSANTALAALPLARVTSSGEENPLRRQTRYRFDIHRAPLAGVWLALLTAIGAICAFGAPRRKAGSENGGGSGSGKSSGARFRYSSGVKRGAVDGPRIEELPHLASVQLARDFSAPVAFSIAAAVRPILSDTSDKLWINFAARADLASAMASVGAAASDPQAGTQIARSRGAAQAVLEQAEAAASRGSNTEILFTRLTDDARGSRAAMLAIGRLLAQRGKRVLLVDLDLAAWLEAKRELGLPGEFPGAAELLSGRAALDDCLLIDDECPSLNALGACAEGDELSLSEASRLLQSAEMLDLLDTLRAGNDLVLIHGPVAASAALALGSRADAALLVVSRTPTEGEHRAFPDALARMSAAQAEFAGRIEFIGDPIP